MSVICAHSFAPSNFGYSVALSGYDSACHHVSIQCLQRQGKENMAYQLSFVATFNHYIA